MRGLIFQPLWARLPSRCPRGYDLPKPTKIFVRNKTVDKGTPKNSSTGRSSERKTALRDPESNRPLSRRPPPKSQLHPKPRATPQDVVIYHAGTGQIVFLGMMRLATFFFFAVSCGVIAPSLYQSDAPWYYAPAILVGSAIPMLFVSVTAAPVVSQVRLALPAFAQQSKEAMMAYLQNVPRTADLSIETMKYNFYPRRNRVSLSDLVPAGSFGRPVSFMNTNPLSQPWWKGRDNVYFYAPEKSRPAKATHKFFPQVWEHVFAQIKQNRVRNS